MGYTVLYGDRNKLYSCITWVVECYTCIKQYNIYTYNMYNNVIRVLYSSISYTRRINVIQMNFLLYNCAQTPSHNKAAASQAVSNLDLLADDLDTGNLFRQALRRATIRQPFRLSLLLTWQTTLIQAISFVKLYAEPQ
jgi:hypothetical protein